MSWLCIVNTFAVVCDVVLHNVHYLSFSISAVVQLHIYVSKITENIILLNI